MGNRDRKTVEAGLLGVLQAGEDLLANVVRNDRLRAGRPTPDGPSGPQTGGPDRTDDPGAGRVSDSMTGLSADKPVILSAIVQSDNPAAVHAGHPRGRSARQAAGSPAPPRPRVRAFPEDSLTLRVDEAGRMARGTTCTVTLRIPREFNEWLDEYVHRSWPVRVRKQELVVEALRLLFARRGRAGEPLAETDLIPGPGS